MSGRLCSIAWPVFFARLIVPHKEPMQRRLADTSAVRGGRIAQLEQGAAPVLAKPVHDQIDVGFGLTRIAVAAERTGTNVAPAPKAYARGTHFKSLGGLAVGRSAGAHGAKIDGFDISADLHRQRA